MMPLGAHWTAARKVLICGETYASHGTRPRRSPDRAGPRAPPRPIGRVAVLHPRPIGWPVPGSQPDCRCTGGMPKFILKSAILTVTALSAVLPAAAHAASPKAPAAPAGACGGADSATGSSAAQVRAMRCLVAATRRAAGRRALRANRTL